MYSILISAIFLTSLNAHAISFITEEEVQQVLGAQKVIEIHKYTVADRLVEENSACHQTTRSKSARAYVVKKDDKSLIYVGTNLENLQFCGEI